jgi:hypothetical protein
VLITNVVLYFLKVLLSNTSMSMFWHTPSSWKSDTPIFHVQLSTDDMWFVEEVSADEELVEKIKKLDKAGMDMLRNMMDSADLLK